MKPGISKIAILFVVTLVLTAAAAISGSVSTAEETGPGQTQASTPQPLKQVDSKYVCMITNQLYDKEQIPVVIEDKTYYGCCQMCEAKLKEDPSSRMAVDPVSGKEVDKSKAVIGASSDGKVYYFESVQDLTAYGKTAGQ